MAVPKRRTSRSARDMRRANHDRINVPTLTRCSNCGEVSQPHRVCGACGFYGETQVIEKPEPTASE